MKKEFRFDLELAKKHLESIFPNEMVRNSYLKAITECAKIATKENNANWNVNLSNHLIRVNCGARYIFDMRNERLRVMCWRETFLKLDKDFIDEFLKEVFFHKEDTKELMASDFNPQTYEELEKVPANILWHNSLQFNINPKLWAEKYAEKLMPSVLDFCKDCIKHSSIMPQMRKAHSASLIELINKEMNENLIQPEYIKEQLNYENDDLERFKSLLEYFVTHLEWCENQDEKFSGYEKFIKPIEKFRSTGKGEKGNGIQSQINNWDCYKGRRIGITIYNSHGRGYQQRNCYLHWMETWYNIHANWENNHITSLYLSKEPKVDAKKELEKTIKELGLFQKEITDDLKDFFNEYMKYGIGDTQMTQENTFVKKYANLLKNTKNLILTGAPGTGKTYLAKQIAKELGCEDDNIGFVQFHPSYDYTDFVEGLRPVQDENGNGSQIGFERKDGVFKAFCARALKESYRENNENVDNFEECWERLVEELNENNYIDISLLSGKGNLRVELNEYGTGLANRTYENDDYQEGNWISGKSKFFSKDQLYNIYQGLPGVPAGGHDNYRKAIVEYMKKNLGLLDYKKTESTQKTKKNFVFIIDEINRGEVAKIFGELFYCVDPGYRGEKGRISTQYQNLVTCGEFQKGFFIPENVYIIGTMNDIDRSVESMDFAFRRRFTWAEVKASDTVDMLYPSTNENGESTGLESKELADEAKRRMENLNNAISEIEGLNEAYHIGASYFLKLKNYDGNFESLWEYHIKGILQEYLRGSGNEAKIAELKAAYDREEEN
jgi:DNA polymerase III delta prime subunit